MLAFFFLAELDSSLIAAIACGKRLPCFTISTDSKYDESVFAQRVANKFKLDLNLVKLTDDLFYEAIDEWFYFNDDPIGDPSGLALFVLSKKIKEFGIKVMLAGEGADEVFGGYNSYYRSHFLNSLHKVKKIKQIANLILKRNDRNLDYLDSEFSFFGTSHAISGNCLNKMFKVDNLQLKGLKLANDNIYNPNLMFWYDLVNRVPNDLYKN